jgi:hypothetical protein
VGQERLDEVAEKLNRRPRKTLGFKTPAEMLAELLDGLEQADAERCRAKAGGRSEISAETRWEYAKRQGWCRDRLRPQCKAARSSSNGHGHDYGSPVHPHGA